MDNFDAQLNAIVAKKEADAERLKAEEARRVASERAELDTTDQNLLETAFLELKVIAGQLKEKNQRAKVNDIDWSQSYVRACSLEVNDAKLICELRIGKEIIRVKSEPIRFMINELQFAVNDRVGLAEKAREWTIKVLRDDS